jgi:hypothetical protein
MVLEFSRSLRLSDGIGWVVHCYLQASFGGVLSKLYHHIDPASVEQLRGGLPFAWDLQI